MEAGGAGRGGDLPPHEKTLLSFGITPAVIELCFGHGTLQRGGGGGGEDRLWYGQRHAMGSSRLLY